MRRAPIVVVAAAVLALGACSGGKKAVTTAGRTTASPSSTPATTAPGDTATTATPASQPSAAPAGSSGAPAASTGATAKPATAATTPATAGGNTPAQSPAAPSANSSASAAPVYAGKPTTKPGKYHYAVSGTSSFGAPPSGADVVVDPPSGSSQHSQLTSGDQNSGSTDTTLDYKPDGVHLIDLTTKSAAGTLQFHPNPAPLIFPASFAKGAVVGPFDMTSTDGKEKATVKVTIQDVGVQVATGHEKSYPTIQAEVDTTLACTNPADAQCLSGTLNSTRWLGYDGLQIKSHDTTNAKFGAYQFTSDTTSLVDKTTPS